MLNKLNDIKSRLISESAFGIAVHRIDEESVHIDAIRLVKTQDRIYIDGRWSGIKSWEELWQILDSKSPVWLSISGRGLLTRKVNYTEGENLLGKILPNARLEEFLVQTMETSKGELFVSIVRKEIIEHILAGFRENAIFVTDISLDCFSVPVLIENELIKDDELLTSFSRLKTDHNKILEITAHAGKTETVGIGNDHVDGALIIPFANAFALLLGNAEKRHLEPDELPLRKDDFIFRQRIKYTSIAALIIFLVLLAVNFLFYSSYNSKQAKLTEQLMRNEQIIIQLEKLQEEYEVKNTLFEKSGLNSETRYSFYADRLASVLPDGIYLTQMTLDPLSNKIKEDEPVDTRKNTVYVAGTSNASNILNDWVRKIRKFAWVEDLELINYESEASMHKASFELEIKVK